MLWCAGLDDEGDEEGSISTSPNPMDFIEEDQLDATCVSNESKLDPRLSCNVNPSPPCNVNPSPPCNVNIETESLLKMTSAVVVNSTIDSFCLPLDSHVDSCHTECRHIDNRHVNCHHINNYQCNSRHTNNRHIDIRNMDGRHTDSHNMDSRHQDSHHVKSQHSIDAGHVDTSLTESSETLTLVEVNKTDVGSDDGKSLTSKSNVEHLVSHFSVDNVESGCTEETMELRCSEETKKSISNVGTGETTSNGELKESTCSKIRKPACNENGRETASVEEKRKHSYQNDARSEDNILHQEKCKQTISDISKPMVVTEPGTSFVTPGQASSYLKDLCDFADRLKSEMSSAKSNAASIPRKFSSTLLSPSDDLLGTRQSSVMKLESFVASVDKKSRPKSLLLTEKKPGLCHSVAAGSGSTKNCKKSSKSSSHHHHLVSVKVDKPGGDQRSSQFSVNYCQPLSTIVQSVDEPLDLSKKPCQSKDGATSSDKYIRPVDGGDVNGSSSSLANLELKFGKTSTIFDRIGTKAWTSAYCGTPFVSRFGTSLYNTTLHGVPSTVSVTGVESMTSTVAGQLPTVETYDSKMTTTTILSQTSATSSRSEPMVKPCCSSTGRGNLKREAPSSVTDSGLTDPMLHWRRHTSQDRSAATAADHQKHTNFQCSCGDEMETLYQLTMHLQETGHKSRTANGAGTPRPEYSKLVRGQDMWLNHGCEQTRQILCCIECGESFRSLPELTVHMIQTKHYTNIVGAEAFQQRPTLHPPLSSKESSSESVDPLSDTSSSDSTGRVHCLVCLESFDDAVSLGCHIVEARHYKMVPDNIKEEKESEDAAFHHYNPTTDLVKEDHECEEMVDVKPPPMLPAASHCASTATMDEVPVGEEMYASKDEMLPGESNADRKRRISTSSCNSFNSSNTDRGEADAFQNETKRKRLSTSKRDLLLTVEVKIEEKRSEDSLMPKSHQSASPCGTGQMLTSKVALEKSQETACDVNKSSAMPTGAVDFVRPVTSLVESYKGSSAIQAMESFIKNSFVSSEASRRSSFVNRMQETPVPPLAPFLGRFAAAELAISHHQPATKSNALLYQNKYLPPMYVGQGNIKSSGPSETPDTDMKNQLADVPSKCRGESDSLSLMKALCNGESDSDPKVLCSDSVLEMMAMAASKHVNNNFLSSIELAPTKHNETFAAIETRVATKKRNKTSETDVQKQNSTSENPRRHGSSALDSLHGLVYGKTLNSEHPLDSLQKLIYGGNGGGITNSLSNNGNLAGSTGLTSGLNDGKTGSLHRGTALIMHESTSGLPPGMLILVNPIVTVVPGASGSSPSLNITLPSSQQCHSPMIIPNPSKDDCSSCSPVTAGDAEAVEDRLHLYRCRACKRKFCSKGSYRYHLSRCHVLTTSASNNKYTAATTTALKDSMKTSSPYLCLPLDAASKFSKFYQLASELSTTEAN